MQEANNKIEMNFLKRDCDDKKGETVKPKRKPEEKSALKSANKPPKAPVQRVKIAPYAYVEVRLLFNSLQPTIFLWIKTERNDSRPQRIRHLL